MATLTNLGAFSVQRYIGIHNQLLTRALERLASGYRINRASDDPSGLALADKFRTQVRALQQASQNITLATNFIQTAFDGMTESVGILQDIRDLAIESTNGALSTSDRQKNQTEINTLITEIDRLATAVRFNGIKLLNGAFSSIGPTGALIGGGSFVGSLVFHVGAYSGAKLSTFLSTTSAKSLGVNGLDITSQLKASNAVLLLNSSISRLLSRRARVGGVERRLETAKNMVDIEANAHLATESSIRDADVAAEIVNFTREQILLQASTAMLAQANLVSQNVLQLFRF
ncbi:MAG: hypothetical protein A3G34_03370 [Candidatus Lindowbacteria bacterium RIFCSPLOWO2_12_FULL_62_27]|nr:MAG: hypothetical protein A3I06_16145 [Candidatus Lindowbacteria bacterium RIFCSPLOWO2_02_FULL_62_12]OGH62985.1 MAG: hypothetical protein A3G34_03370 [Candidatus Lindowbacteria bacterium RIFCSPLOWO2_12_FULL_62_27]